MNQPKEELLKIYTQPEKYIFEVIKANDQQMCYSLKAGESSIYRSEHSLSLLVEQRGVNSHPVCITIPMSDYACDLYRECTKELIRRRLPLLTQNEIVRLRCRERVGRPLPIIAEAIVQQLPQGELLSDAVCGSSPSQTELAYTEVSNLERSLQLSHINFESLNATGIILGEDGRLYPFRYEGIKFDYKGGKENLEAVCNELREQIKTISGHAPNKADYPTDDEPYSETLCDINAGYITCRKEREGRIAVEALTGWGFIDIFGRLVIEAKYLSVEDFVNGCAIVRHPQSELYGLIDLQGNYIIRPTHLTKQALKEHIEQMKGITQS